MEDTADADFLGGSCDRVIHLTHAHELKRLHPVAQIVEHEHEVVVMLESLAFHARNGFDLVGGIAVLEELADFSKVRPQVLIAVAAFVEGVRLIDNVLIS